MRKAIVLVLCLLAVAAVLIHGKYYKLKDYSPEWSSVEGKSMRWENALDYCQKLEENGHSDWKLPKIHDFEVLKGEKKGRYWSSNKVKAVSESQENENERAWFYDFEREKRFPAPVSEARNVVCVRNMPGGAVSDIPEEPGVAGVEEVCLHARKTQTEHAWKFYLEMYPNGACANEARTALNKQNSMETAPENPDSMPDNRPVPESQVRVMAEGLEWSGIPVTNISFRDAEKYCRNLRLDGYTGWRLPTIDELRTLVKERKTAAGGECRVSAMSGCLSSKLYNGCWSFETCAEACEHSLDKCSRDNTDGRYSKLGDKIALWSSTSVSDDTSWYWYIDFSNGLLSYGKSDSGSYKLNVRCVR